MNNHRKAALFGVAVIALTGLSSPAGAQATRTWVSGVGDDVNPCSRTAPCKTFAGAISKTAAGGEINCLDPGGFGAVTITKSMAIVCDGIGGGVLATGTNGIVVKAAATDKLLLSGLDIHGGGTGINGVRVVSAASVVIRNSIIQAFSTPGSAGISVAGPAEVTVAGSAIVNNSTGLSGQIISAGNNLLAGNGSDGRFASTKASQ